MGRPIPPIYKTRNWPTYHEALKQRGSLAILFDPDMSRVPPPTGKRDRDPDLSDDASPVRHGPRADHMLRREPVAAGLPALDGAGIKAEGKGAWHARKDGGAKRRPWRKIDIGIDEQTLEIRAVEATAGNVGDAPMLPELLGQIPADVGIGTVTADGAYDTRKCYEAVADRGAHAAIPPRRNARPWTPFTAVAVARNEALRASKYLGRAI